MTIHARKTPQPSVRDYDGLPQCHRIGDRKAAIEHALAQAESGDVVVVAGKGHEPYQIIGTTKHAFSDQEVISACP